MFAEALTVLVAKHVCAVAIGDEQGVLVGDKVPNRYAGYVGKDLVIVNLATTSPYIAYRGVAYALKRNPTQHSLYCLR